MNQFPSQFYNPSMMMMPSFQQGNPYIQPQMYPMGGMGPMGHMGPMMMPMNHMTPMGMGNMSGMVGMGMGNMNGMNNSMPFPSFSMSAPITITSTSSLSPRHSTSLSPPQPQPSPIPAASPPSKPAPETRALPPINRAVTRPIPITTPPSSSDLIAHENNPEDLETKYMSAIKYLSDDMTNQISSIIVPGRSTSNSDIQKALSVSSLTEGKLANLLPTALWLQERGCTKLIESLTSTLSDVRDAVKIYTEMCTSVRSQAECTRILAKSQTESFKESNVYRQNIFNETNQRWLDAFREEPYPTTARVYSLWN